jgi:hypothetical protein
MPEPGIRGVGLSLVMLGHLILAPPLIRTRPPNSAAGPAKQSWRRQPGMWVNLWWTVDGGRERELPPDRSHY